ncbi:MAG TPA: response regulator [Candidatus Acidoferrales bacterium]|nr:response regulator [Candidatus Acidoferrales bacterium]
MTAKSISQFEPAAEPLPNRQPNSRQRILVVDDDSMIRRMNTETLTYSGYEVDAAEDGATAWCAIQQENYDLIVTDNNMPHMTGVELLQLLHEARLSVPVIMATGCVPQDALDRYPWLQIDAMLLKPYSFDELLAAVKNVLSATNASSGEFAPPPNWRPQAGPEPLSL